MLEIVGNLHLCPGWCGRVYVTFSVQGDVGEWSRGHLLPGPGKPPHHPQCAKHRQITDYFTVGAYYIFLVVVEKECF